ncbi:SAGA complex subunit Sgf73 [Coemansia interrupta]|uniref:SAGA complex subunit Sgf73 n=1 Tax=Coemansia interrupta TaxID=1126814 RepID=A0A9W8H9G2_9FUNG|nr:SAGA complex subunit Sgf73 [Coemansia interrupta]
MTGAGNQRANVIRRGLSASGLGSGGGSAYGAGVSNGSGYAGTSSVTGSSAGESSRADSGLAYMDGLTEEQKRELKRKIETIKSLEKDVERLKDERIRGAVRRLDVEAMATVSALSTFGQTSDWRRLDEKETAARQPLATPTRLTWEMIKKAVAEEEKYQSKKNWSSTKGRGNRKAPVARRLDAEVLKRFGVYPALQFPTLATCDSCGRQINAHFLREHQETNCKVSEAKRGSAASAGASASTSGVRGRKAASVSDDEEAGGSKRAASEVTLDEGPGAAKKARVTKKEQARAEKEQREKEKLERREQQRLDKERKKQEREAKRERDQAKARQPVDLDKQCGVVAEPGAAPCSRSLTCKTHSMAMKRAVLGRSKLFDALLQAHLAKSRSAAAAKNAASRSAAAGNAGNAVRDAMAMVLGEDGRVDASFFDEDEDDEELGSDEEAEKIIAAVACSRGKPLAVRPMLLPRRRHHYLRVRDLFFDALKPPMGSGSAEQPESLAT